MNMVSYVKDLRAGWTASGLNEMFETLTQILTQSKVDFFCLTLPQDVKQTRGFLVTKHMSSIIYFKRSSCTLKQFIE